MTTLFLIATSRNPWGVPLTELPAHATIALRSARRFSGCKVVALSEWPDSEWEATQPYEEQLALADKLAAANYSVGPLNGWLARWWIMDAYCKQHAVQGAIVNLDWDMLVLADIEAHLASLCAEHYDCGCFRDQSDCSWSNRTAPFYLREPAIITHFVGLLEASIMQRAHMWRLDLPNNDMHMWCRLQTVMQHLEFDAGQIVQGKMLDHTMIRVGQFESGEDGCKLPSMQDDHWAFKNARNGQPVQAVTIHCMMHWKLRMNELLQCLS